MRTHNIFVAVFFVVLSTTLLAQDVDHANKHLDEAVRRRDSVVKALEDEIRTVDKDRLIAIKDKRWEEAKALLQRLKELRKQVPLAQARAIEDYASDIVSEKKRAADNEKRAQAERKEAEQRAAEQQALAMRREAAAKEAADQRAVAAREAAAAAAKVEQDRQEKSGGCPLKVWSATWQVKDVDSIRRGYRLLGVKDTLPDHLFGQCIFVTFNVENCTDAEVAAYELRVQFLNGFDEIIKEEVLQGIDAAPKEVRRIDHGWSKVETTVRVRVLIERTKLRNGQLWKREPHHQLVSATTE